MKNSFSNLPRCLFKQMQERIPNSARHFEETRVPFLFSRLVPPTLNFQTQAMTNATIIPQTSRTTTQSKVRLNQRLTGPPDPPDGRTLSAASRLWKRKWGGHSMTNAIEFRRSDDAHFETRIG
jgi:hypothetical protein